MRRPVLAFLAIFGASAILASALMPEAATSQAQPAAEKGQAVNMAETALAFLATLTPEQRAKVAHRFEDDAVRTGWSNLPPGQGNQDGLMVSVLTEPQRIAFHDMLMAATSSQGYSKSAAIMWLDDILRNEETGRFVVPDEPPQRGAAQGLSPPRRSSANYRVVMFGEPGGARWGWMLTGHHLAANFTVVDGAVAFTPLFVGANPQVVRDGPYAGWRVLGHETARGFALARSLTGQQRRTAVVSGAVSDALFTGKGRKDELKTMAGIPASQLSAGQQQLLWALVREFVETAGDEAAAAQMRSIERDGLDKLHFAWWGST